jgi:hypothetical protein
MVRARRYTRSIVAPPRTDASLEISLIVILIAVLYFILR